jgi:hypothetical protein
VRDNTGFDLLVEGEPPTTEMPAADELLLLRQRVDRRGALRAKA